MKGLNPSFFLRVSVCCGALPSLRASALLPLGLTALCETHVQSSAIGLPHYINSSMLLSAVVWAYPLSALLAVYFPACAHDVLVTAHLDVFFMTSKNLWSLYARTSENVCSFKVCNGCLVVGAYDTAPRCHYKRHYMLIIKLRLGKSSFQVSGNWIDCSICDLHCLP